MTEEIATDPRTLTPAGLAARGFRRISRGDAIRLKCLDCAGSFAEVRRCECAGCPLWLFRMGTDPWREAREMTDEQRQAASDRLARAREAKATT